MPWRETRFVDAGDDSVHIHLDYPEFTTTIQELTDQWRINWITGESIQYDGNLPPGEAIAFLARIQSPSAVPHYELIVWEAFNAQTREIDSVGPEYGVAWWIQNGPTKLRRIGDAAWIWTSQTTSDPGQFGADLEQKLEDGKVAKLIGTCRMNQWPFCWWDSQGNPVGGFLNGLAVCGGSNDDPWVAVEVEGPTAEENLLMPLPPSGPARQGGYAAEDCAQIHEHGPHFEAGFLVGPWIELGQLKFDQTIRINQVTYGVKRIDRSPPNHFGVSFTRSGVRENEEILVAVGAHGTQIEPNNPPPSPILFANDPRLQNNRKPVESFEMAAQDVKYFRIMQRKRQWVTFRDFVLHPSTEPQLDVTETDIAAAQKSLWLRQRQKQLDLLRPNQAIGDAIVADQSTPNGVVKMAVRAVQEGNEAALHALMLPNAPRDAAYQNLRIHLLLVAQANWRKTVARLGQEAYDEQIGAWEICQDIEPLVVARIDKLNQAPDGTWQVPIFGVARKASHGKYHLELKASQIADLQTQAARADAFARLISQSDSLPLNQFVARMNRLP